ncbi:EF-hand domain-containing protein [Allokutzneria sp. A3M-2-11 16]|uniref:EF-hand domain-containing protein n=1 Tax=Allokutzneria sp. A3M-2-11 16 TaxID=2962043 RepID=UPI0020B77343|nr:EF-hand domain-containing protein [Allokutzneria sp. A3M-2-11 16]MCP3800848.1 EF-hand domain-containing protein [Allokutzneria sp. A3M-2-11 16]
MSADILTRKYEKAFLLYDHDGDGIVDQADLRQIQDQFLLAFGAADSEKGAVVRERWDDFWAALTSAIDSDLDDRLTREEFVGGMRQLSVGEAADFDAVFRPLVEAIFTLMDSDSSGVVTDEEFRQFQAGIGNADQADAALAKIDRDGDGVLTLDEMTADIREYLTSDDPENSNNWFLGEV